MRYIIFLTILFLMMGVPTSWPGVENILRPNFSFLSANIYSKENAQEIDDPFKDLHLEARAAVVLNLSDDSVVFEKNPDLDWPLASLTKLVTAAVFYDLAPAILKEGSLVIPITRDAVRQEGDDGFLVAESFDVKDLIEVMLVRSSNDAAFALSSWLQNDVNAEDSSWFINEMNLFVSRLELHKTYFLNSTGLDVDERLAGAYSTASEVARLFSQLLRNYAEVISVTSKPEIIVYSIQGNEYVFESVAKPIMQIPELIAVKTGYTELAGGNLVFAFSIGLSNQFVVAVLGSSFDERFVDALKLYDATSQYVKSI